ncbi:MAG: hypothetical protein Q9191_002118 [Dirinaria sp. TL-2023a]
MTVQQYSALAGSPLPARPLLGRESVAFGHNFLRDQFTITTWLLLGAVLQALLVALPIRTLYAVAPAVTLLVWQVVDALMMSFGLKRNIYMDNVVQTKCTALVPDEQGSFSRASVGKGGEGVCVFILGFRVNHPLSVAAPGARGIFHNFTIMRDDLEANAAQNGFLGSEFLLNSGQRTTRSELKSVWYFRSTEDVMAWAHSPVHRRGWELYNKTIKKYNHLGIMHEMYESPAGDWENIYVNHQPVGLASSAFPIRSEDGNLRWVDPLVDARKGRLASTAGRLGKDVSGE